MPEKLAGAVLRHKQFELRKAFPMGPLNSAAFSATLRATAKVCLPALAAGLLISCISDGTNHTGAEYLSGHGILLENPLYHVRVKGFPADTFWTTSGRFSHLNDTILLAGRKDGYAAEARLSYQIADTAYFDSLGDDPASLRLSLSTPTWKNVGYWTDNGDSVLRSFSDSSADSMAFEAVAWDFTNEDVSDEAWKDSLSRWNRRYLIDGDTVPLLPGPSSFDTVVFRVKDAYDVPGQLQSANLPHLKALFLAAPGRKHAVHLRLVPLPAADSADTLPAMLRFAGSWPYSSNVGMPSLLFGRNLRSDSLGDKNRVIPYDLGGGIRGVAYSLRYSGPRTDLSVPLQRSLHFSLDRERLLDSLDAGLRRQGIEPPPRSGDPLSLAYYVPFAAVSLPMEAPSLEGGLPVQVKLYSSVDTLLGDTLDAGTRVDRLLAGDTLTAWYTYEIGQPGKIANQVRLVYAKIDSLYRITLSYSKDSASNDTVYLPPGGVGQIASTLPGFGSGGTLFIHLEADGDTVIARSYVDVRSGEERNVFRDPSTGKTITDLDALVPRFVQPSDSVLRLRGTAGIRALVNRSELGKTARQEFEFRPVTQAYNPKAVTTGGETVAYPVSFPVLSTLHPRIQSGVLSVDLDVYLYPLGAR